MVRFLVSTLISILASAVGLIVAAAILDDMSINGSAFFVAVLIFTGVTALAGASVAQEMLAAFASRYSEQRQQSGNP